MYGWRIAFLLSIPAMLVNHLLHGIPLSMLPSAWVLSALVPILISYLIFCSATVTFHVTFLFSFLWLVSSMEHSPVACIYSSTRFIIFLWVITTGKLSNTTTLFSFRYSPSLKAYSMGCLWPYWPYSNQNGCEYFQTETIYTITTINKLSSPINTVFVNWLNSTILAIFHIKYVLRSCFTFVRNVNLSTLKMY